MLNNTILRRSLLGLSGAAMALALVWFGRHALAAPVVQVADANDNTRVEFGRHGYRLYCASCHGRARAAGTTTLAAQRQGCWQACTGT